MNGYNYGFRIVGDCTGERRLVDASAALSAYASCDSRCNIAEQSYLSPFQYGPDFRQHLKNNSGSVKGYDGACWYPTLKWDIDRSDLTLALRDTRLLASHLRDHYHYGDDLLLFFSGSKGFHVEAPLDEQPSQHFNKVSAAVASHIAYGAGLKPYIVTDGNNKPHWKEPIDHAIYRKTQPFRAANSTHAKTGLHKVWLAFDELMSLPIEAIQEIARQPRPYTIPEPSQHLHELWTNPPQLPKHKAQPEGHKVSTQNLSTQKLNRQTMEFIRDGAGEGERALRLFSAAANLGEMGCPRDLAHALLTEPALDCGLSFQETRRQIDCGWKKGGRDE